MKINYSLFSEDELLSQKGEIEQAVDINFDQLSWTSITIFSNLSPPELIMRKSLLKPIWGRFGYIGNRVWEKENHKTPKPNALKK